MSGTAVAGTETNDCIWCLTSFNRQVSKTPLSQQADALSRSHDNRVFASHTDCPHAVAVMHGNNDISIFLASIPFRYHILGLYSTYNT